VFQALRRGTIAGSQLEHEFQGRPPAQVLCATNSALVFLDPAVDVECNARIKAAVRAT